MDEQTAMQIENEIDAWDDFDPAAEMPLDNDADGYGRTS